MPVTIPLKLNQYSLPVLILLTVSLLLLLSVVTRDSIEVNRKQHDRLVLEQLLGEVSYDNDLLEDAITLSLDQDDNPWIKPELLGLRQDRLAYLVKSQGEVTSVVVPATADDGFNGQVDLLIAIDMYGRIQGVDVIQAYGGTETYGVLELIESQWLTLFSGSTFRDIQRLSWQTIAADNEYDLFVGASVTPKTVSAKIYDALIFFQSNRMAFVQRGINDV